MTRLADFATALATPGCCHPTKPPRMYNGPPIAIRFGLRTTGSAKAWASFMSLAAMARNVLDPDDMKAEVYAEISRGDDSYDGSGMCGAIHAAW